jgi:secondary thiamine-phosphate synthase enzyme
LARRAALESSVAEIKVKSTCRIEAKDITELVSSEASGVETGFVHLFCEHTTCGLTINENADPDVMKDVIDALNRLAPADYPYRHGEGNSDAHIKSSLIGHSLLVPVRRGRLELGTWQGIYLMEFDGPRERKIFVSWMKS